MTEPYRITTQVEADAVFGAGSPVACLVADVFNPQAHHPGPFGLAALSAEEREEFSRQVDAAITGTDEESAEAVGRIIELAGRRTE